MSRSRKKHAFGGMAGNSSEKDHKQRTHRKMRAQERTVLAHFGEGDEVKMPYKGRDAVNPWDGAKDGKQVLDERWIFGRDKMTAKQLARARHKLIAK